MITRFEKTEDIKIQPNQGRQSTRSDVEYDAKVIL